jgi:hypothetical protein
MALATISCAGVVTSDIGPEPAEGEDEESGGEDIGGEDSETSSMTQMSGATKLTNQKK